MQGTSAYIIRPLRIRPQPLRYLRRLSQLSLLHYFQRPDCLLSAVQPRLTLLIFSKNLGRVQLLRRLRRPAGEAFTVTRLPAAAC